VALPIIYLILLIVGTVIIYKDIADISDNFLVEEKLFVLVMNKEVTASFSIKGTEPAVIIEDLTNIKALPYKELGYYKVLLFSWESFEDLQEFEFGGEKLTRIQAKQILESTNAMQTLADISQIPIGAIEEAYKTNDMLKGDLFGNMASAAADEESILMALRAGRVKIVPETITFKLIKILPMSIIEKMVPESGIAR